MLKPIDLQYRYKKQVGFTNTQKQSLLILESYGVNINDFIRIAVREKIKRDWPEIKEKKDRLKYPF